MLTAATEQWTGQAFPDWARGLSLAILIRRFYLLTPTPDRCPMKPTAMMTLLALAGLMSACASGPTGPAGADWHAVPLPGKVETVYAWTTKDGRPALHTYLLE